MPSSFYSVYINSAILCCLLAGCASTRPASLAIGQTQFKKVGVIDFRRDSIDDFRRLAKPGDLIVGYMRPGRAVRQKEWLFVLLPHGHAMVVIDPNDPKGLFECRFRGCQRIGPEELGLYSYNTIYRLDDPSCLDVRRLSEFADASTERCHTYSFLSWLGVNDNLAPNTVDEISPKYTCSTAVAAAYHYAGATLSVNDQATLVITPTSLAMSAVTPNAVEPRRTTGPDGSAAASENPSE